MAAECERRPHDRRQGDAHQILWRSDDARRRDFESTALDSRLEELAVLRALDRVEARTDQLDPQLAEDSRLFELACEVQRGTAAHRREQRVGTFAAEHG